MKLECGKRTLSDWFSDLLFFKTSFGALQNSVFWFEKKFILDGGYKLVEEKSMKIKTKHSKGKEIVIDYQQRYSAIGKKKKKNKSQNLSLYYTILSIATDIWY